MAPQTGQTTTEKYLPFQLARVRLSSVFGPQVEPLVVTGSAQEEVNSVCVWQYNRYPNYAANFANIEVDNDLPSPLNDSADEPRLVCSAVHAGDVQQLRSHVGSRLVFTGSSMGFLGIYRLALPGTEHDAFQLHEVATWSRGPADPADELIRIDVPISDVCVSTDAAQIYAANDLGQLFVLDTEMLAVKQQLMLTASGSDLSTINAIESIDASCIATANQIGQLNVWDLRSPDSTNLSQKRIVPRGEPRPLTCLSQHPGQSHLLAVGGMNSGHGGGHKHATTTSYIWDLRAERHPLSEIVCRGSVVWEIGFHPHQPQFLYLATEEAGLMRIKSASSAESWSFLQSCQQKLSATCVTSNPADYCSVTTFDMASGFVVCGRDNCALQTIKDTSVSTFSCE
ncbi:unnamed protein product [Mesocestoides corti]|uniref:WD_REPEATS_REGION domain-containing protein n=1 Tax=Mesocestoides corti TaxID=53468 RepID=A0A0R3U731_MESCO|nr:unnamed protein product [Mesocestoides corti]